MAYQMIQKDALARGIPGSNVLIVEDDALLACDLEDVLSDCGASPVGPAFSLDSGLELAQSEAIDVALLDINLGEELVWPLAQKLQETDIPFAFLSAACGRYDLPDNLKDAVCIDKPASPQEIVGALQFLLEG